jgi:hypothetical protein
MNDSDSLIGRCRALDQHAEEQRWVAWRNEARGDRLTKVPYCGTDKKAKADDPATWLCRTEAERVAERIVNGLGGGIGYELGDLGNDLFIAGVDLDSCLNGDRLADWAAEVLAAIPTYGEISPSGTGLKLFFHLASEDVRPFLDLIGVPSHQWGCRRDVPGANGRDHGPAIEVYFSHRYFAVTGQHWPDLPERIEFLEWEVLQRLGSSIPRPKSADGSSAKGAGDNSRSAAAFRKGAALRRAGKTFEEMVATLRSDPETAAWVREKGEAAGGRELRRIWEKAVPLINGAAEDAVSLDDFHAYMPMHNYIFVPTREPWPASSVNARISPIPLIDASGQPVLNEENKPLKQKAASWLDQNRPVEQMTWAPGRPMLISNQLTDTGGWIDRQGVTCFNLYREPHREPGDATKAGLWTDHVRRVYPEDADHILCFLAHRVQRPEEKINHALVLGGLQGIGKDSLLEPAKRAVGPWNWGDISPHDLFAPFNGFVKSVVLRVNEARDLGEVNRFQFYERMKSYITAPPDVLRVNEKHLREYYVVNCCAVIITTNHKSDGIYLPADDRRHFVAWSILVKEDFTDTYWDKLWTFYDNGGARHVAAYLAELDITAFKPKAPPPKTTAFWDIVSSNRTPEDAEMADVFDDLGNPAAVVMSKLILAATGEFGDWLRDRKNRRNIPHRLEACGYQVVRNPDATDGLWKVFGKRQTIYGKAALPYNDRLRAAREIIKWPC